MFYAEKSELHYITKNQEYPRHAEYQQYCCHNKGICSELYSLVHGLTYNIETQQGGNSIESHENDPVNNNLQGYCWPLGMNFLFNSSIHKWLKYKCKNSANNDY